MNDGEKCRPLRVALKAAAVAASAAVALLIARGRGLAAGQTLQMKARGLCDGLFVVGLWVFGIGALLWIASEGFFDMTAYSVRYGLHALLGFLGLRERPKGETFYDYKMEKEKKRRRPGKLLLIVGAAYIALSLVCMKVSYMP